MYIRQMTVTNYRSLKRVSVGQLSSLVVFYGENDTGKSNILSFLELVFKQKYIEEITESRGGEAAIQRRPTGFWRGRIDNFSDNFFSRTDEPIAYSILIRFMRSELKSLSALPDEFFQLLPPNSRYDHLKINGHITSTGPEQANMTLASASLDNLSFYDGTLTEASRFMPAFDLTAAQKNDVFNSIMGTLDDAFIRVPPDRYLTSEKERNRTDNADLKSVSFKNWLFQISIDRELEEVFRRISEQFGAEPFNHGRISIARTSSDEIEAFVEKNGLKLPIGRKGSGVQQILMILAHVAASRSPIIGIEELEINLSPNTQRDIFNSLLELVHSQVSPVKQILLTTHSRHIARRDDAARRVVWMDKDGATLIRRPSEAEIDYFFGDH